MYYLLVYTDNQWRTRKIIEDYDYTKVQEYLLILDKHNYLLKDQLQQQSLVHQQQLLQLQQQLDTERRMRRNMALQLDKIQESSANRSHSNTSTGNIVCINLIMYVTTCTRGGTTVHNTI